MDVVIGAVDEGRFLTDRLPGADPTTRRTFATLMAAQRWRLAMYASCGWFWETPDRVETGLVIRAATHAATLIDGIGPTDLARTLASDLAALERIGEAAPAEEVTTR